MANVGSAAAGKTLIGNGNGASPTYASIGTNSGLTAHGVVIAEGNGAFQATAAGNDGQILTGVSGSNPIWMTPSPGVVALGNVSINFLNTGVTTLFTTGNKNFSVMGISIYATDVTGFIAASTENIGWTGPNYNDFLINNQLDSTNTSTNFVYFQTTGGFTGNTVIIPPNTTVKINITAGATATTNTQTVSFIGFYLS